MISVRGKEIMHFRTRNGKKIIIFLKHFWTPICTPRAKAGSQYQPESTWAHLTMFEFGGHANLAGLSLLDIRASLDSPIYFPEWPTIEICCIFVPQSVQICLQSSKIRPPNSNID